MKKKKTDLIRIQCEKNILNLFGKMNWEERYDVVLLYRTR